MSKIKNHEFSDDLESKGALKPIYENKTYKVSEDGKTPEEMRRSSEALARSMKRVK